MYSTDDKWIHHGEPSDAEINDNEGNLDEPIGFNEDVGMNVRKASMMMIIGFMTWWRSCIQLNNKMEVVAVNPCLQKILEEMKKELYPGAAYSRFSFVVTLLRIKSFYRISNVAFTAILKLLSSAFPDCSLPVSYCEAKNLLRAMGPGYDSIHVCPKNCVLFRKEHAKKDKCLVCGESRWKDKDGKTKIPQKVLHHFSLIASLKRMLPKR
jgi:hypothetical protein